MLQLRLGQRYGGSPGLQPVCVEGLRRQSTASNIQQVAGREKHISLQFGGDQFAFTGVERADINAISPRIDGTGPIREVEEMFAVRQEEGPPIRLNAALAHNPGDGSGSAATRRNPMQGPSKGGPKHNRPIAIPSTSPGKERIAKNLHRIAGNIHGFKSCVSEESYLAAIRGPEWQARSFSAVELLRTGSGKGPHPQGCLSV